MRSNRFHILAKSWNGLLFAPEPFDRILPKDGYLKPFLLAALGVCDRTARDQVTRERSHGMGSDNTSRLFGAWRVVSYTAQSPHGQSIHLFGRGAQGRFILEPGRFMAQLMNPRQA